MITSKNKIKVILGIAVFSLVSALAAIYFNNLNNKRHSNSEWHYEEVDPIYEWFEIGIERKKIEDKYSTNNITKEQYIDAISKIWIKEQNVIEVFPNNPENFEVHEKTKNESKKLSIELWIAIYSSVLASIGTLSGVLLAWRNDRRAAIDTEIKLMELREKFEKHN